MVLTFALCFHSLVCTAVVLHVKRAYLRLRPRAFHFTVTGSAVSRAQCARGALSLIAPASEAQLRPPSPGRGRQAARPPGRGDAADGAARTRSPPRTRHRAEEQVPSQGD